MTKHEYLPLVDGHIYRLGDMLLEAKQVSRMSMRYWYLHVLSESGEYVTERAQCFPTEGVILQGYSCGSDGWREVYMRYEDAHWSVANVGVPFAFPVDDLCFVAESRDELIEKIDDDFREIMAALGW